MNHKSPIRPVIRDLEPSGITKVTALGLGNPEVLPLWFGETDLVTPPFIRQAAIQALEDGRTFYTNARGIQPLREAIRDFHKRTVGADIALERSAAAGRTGLTDAGRTRSLAAWFDAANRTRELLRTTVRADLAVTELLLAWRGDAPSAGVKGGRA